MWDLGYHTVAKAQEEPLERVSFPQGQKPRVTVYDCVGGPDAFLDGNRMEKEDK